MNNILPLSFHGQPYQDELEFTAEYFMCIDDVPLDIKHKLIEFKKMEKDIEFNNEKELIDMIDSDIQDAWTELHHINNFYNELGLTGNDFIYP